MNLGQEPEFEKLSQNFNDAFKRFKHTAVEQDVRHKVKGNFEF